MQVWKIFTCLEILMQRYVSYLSKSEEICLMETEVEAMLSRWGRLRIKAIWAVDSILMPIKFTTSNSQTQRPEPAINRQVFSRRTFHISTNIIILNTVVVKWNHRIISIPIEAKVDPNLCKIQSITIQKEIWARSVF